MANLLTAHAEIGGTLVTSTLTITEFLAGTSGSTRVSLDSVPGLSFWPLDDEVAELAAHHQRQSKLHIGDAIHLATAVAAKAQGIVTNDRQLARAVAGQIPVIGLD